MRREGRQHGTVRTHILDPSLATRRIQSKSNGANRLAGPPVAGVFAKVQSKPTNHSKFTGRCHDAMCMSCRDQPVPKSKGKAKDDRRPKWTDLCYGDGLEYAGGEWVFRDDDYDERAEDETIDDHLIESGAELDRQEDQAPIEQASEIAPAVYDQTEAEDCGDWFLVGDMIVDSDVLSDMLRVSTDGVSLLDCEK
ncbi:uncharacterized protein LOC109722692 [Ananas comosus]|uniref:Uncharacterized protein LOC109722692 n=1 Tax=Ananas comosus TaxID=4615 RepID=A0A6P5GEX1_ANACO|nr:uncharacterized protein LOC109722692 [Ananas comosus]